MTDDQLREADHDPVPYLSERWVERADAALRGLDPIPAPLTVAMVVTGGPRGDTRYRLVLGPDRVGMDGEAEPAGVTMTVPWDVAVAIAQGRSSAQRAFLDGRLRLGGDTLLLLGHQDALAGIDDRLADLRATTTFD